MGEPRDFHWSKFIVGHGALDVLAGRSRSLRGGHSFFESDLLEPSRTIELPDPAGKREVQGVADMEFTGEWKPPITDNLKGPWTRLDNLPAVLDVFNDGSLFIVDAPGHLPGHINLLARTLKDDGNVGWVYLAGDACHDRRIIRGEKSIGEWLDAQGEVCCMHADRAQAEQTIERIRELEREGVEVILAHDVEWAGNASNAKRFFGAW